MAATACLVLLVAGVAQAAVPEPCQGDLASWCQDAAVATRCQQEQECRDLWDSLAPGDVAGGNPVAAGKGLKCSVCTKILEKMKEVAGDDPDEAMAEAALGKGCKVLGRRLGRLCRGLVRKFRQQLSQALQDGDEPRAACAAIGLCKA